MRSMSTREVSPTNPKIFWCLPSDAWISSPWLFSQVIRFSNCTASGFSFNMTIMESDSFARTMHRMDASDYAEKQEGNAAYTLMHGIHII